ncbi:MAG: MmcQ/YjbR family DNA-binding protein [Clostridia bacterium]|nr:MmcQ/YjbR family DNA-binding protein [Clostridia bacterium]
MTLEESYFRRRRFVPERMLEYGFSETDSGYTLESVLEDCGFSARLTVSSEGKVKGVVWDPLNEEPYTLFRSDSQNGPFVSTVRSAYTRFLDSVSSQCCELLPFGSDQANRIAEWVRIRYGIEPDYPFDEEPYRTTGVFRHPDSRKWFGLVMEVPRKKLFRNRNEEPVSVLNVKADSLKIPLITERDGFFQAYHMSKRNWISILLDDTLEDETVQAALTDSYELTLSHKKGKTK